MRQYLRLVARSCSCKWRNASPRLCAEDGDVTESLLGADDERQARPEPLLEYEAPDAGSRPAVNHMEQFVQLVSSSIVTCASSLGACVHWVLSGAGKAQLSQRDLERIGPVLKLLQGKFDHDNPAHQVGSASNGHQLLLCQPQIKSGSTALCCSCVWLCEATLFDVMLAVTACCDALNADAPVCAGRTWPALGRVFFGYTCHLRAIRQVD